MYTANVAQLPAVPFALRWPRAPRRDPTPEASIHRLVLWNIDLTLLDVGRVTRDAYVEAFRRVTGRPLVQLPQLAGRLESGIFFDALALNGVSVPPGPASQELLVQFSHELASAFAARQDDLTERGRLLPGAAQAVADVGTLHGVVQTVLTGTIRPNAVLKLRAFGLDRFFDTEVGGYGSQVYPKGAQLLMTRSRAAEKYGVAFGEDATVYIADSTRDVEAARAGGARCLAVASGRSSVGELRAAGADAVFADLTDTAAVRAAVDQLTLAAAG
jgi:phosphoglycolate phosphatase-like HAD superfamily hydrolase